MEVFGIIFIVYLVFCFIFGAITEEIAQTKEDKKNGFAFGFWLGIVGLVIVASRKSDKSEVEKVILSLKENDYLLNRGLMTETEWEKERQRLSNEYTRLTSK